jgi:alkyldihydroxyacetonephosphate synthase
MKRWNGWGDESIFLDLQPQGLELLKDRIGPGRPVTDFTLDKMLAKIPVSRIPQHSLISTDPKV